MSSSIIRLSLSLAAITCASPVLAYTHEQYQPSPYQQDYPPAAALATVGGATTFLPKVSTPQPDDEVDHNGAINYNFISKILRLTCEMNRQLHFGTRDHTLCGNNIPSITDPASSQLSHVLTIFHGKTPRTRNKTPIRGVERWGPNLKSYLHELQSTLKCSPTCVALALIYLDRACSAETNRHTSACPYLLPRTVHRMLLTAMVIAAESLGHDVDRKKVLETFGMTEKALEVMEHWMMGALGDQGVWVSQDMVEGLLRRWQEAAAKSGSEKLNSDETFADEKGSENENPLLQQRGSSSVQSSGDENAGYPSSGQWIFSYSERRITTVHQENRHSQGDAFFTGQSQWGQYQHGDESDATQISDYDDSDTNGELLWA